jgi:EmrB/QacA subfamily drug resistance transporter
LALGLAVFGIGSVASAAASSSGQLMATRGLMGVGGALIMPATLSIITNVFTVPAERAKAIAIWAAVAGLGVGLGPVIGGWLLEHFYWGSIFLVNIPIVVVAIVGGRLLIPESRDLHAPKLDPVGAGLSIAASGAVLYGIIEGPQAGWTSTTVLTAFAVGVTALGAFIGWELHTDEPMLPMNFFRRRRFTAATVAITTVFFALFSAQFVLTQLLQSVLGYSALQAGVRMLPVSVMLVAFARISTRLVPRVGTKAVVTFGLATVAVGLFVGASFEDRSGYGLIFVTVTLVGVGMGCTMAPATESIMGSIPRQRAGVGSAVNDTTRQMGGALGVAIVGSVLSSAYRAALAPATASGRVPATEGRAARASINSAVQAAHNLRGDQAHELLTAAKHAFIHAAHQGLLVAAAVAAVGALVAAVFLPARSDEP